MAYCEFTRPVPPEAATLLARIKQVVEARGGTWTGDTERGEFALRTPLGPLKGHYYTFEGQMEFVVVDKPRFIPCATIEHVLDKYLSGRS